MSSQSALPCHGSAFGLLNRTHLSGPTLQTDQIRPSSIFCCGSHSVEQPSCRIQRPDNQRCLLPTAFKDSSVRTTASAPLCLARARFVYDYTLYKFTFIIIIIIICSFHHSSSQPSVDAYFQSLHHSSATHCHLTSNHPRLCPTS